MKKIIIIFIILSSNILFAFDKSIYYLDMPSYNSYRDFIRGVKYYDEERYEVSIERFKSALNSNPSDKLIRYWYSRALYQGGYDNLALNEWENLIRMGETDLIIQSKINKYGSVLASSSIESTLSNFIYLGEFSTDISFLENINQPIDIKVENDGNIYVLDYSDSALKIFDVNGIQTKKIDYGIQPVAKKTILTTIRSLPIIRNIPKLGLKAELLKPRSFDIDEIGNIYIANTGRDIIYKYDNNGKYITNIGNTGYQEGNLYGPSGIDVANDGRIYVADTGNNRVSIFTIDGQYLSSFGEMGHEDGQFFRPYSVAVNDQYIFVADAGNKRIQKFDTYGTYIETLNIASLLEPYFVGFASDGNLFIADGKKVFYYDIEASSSVVFQNSTRYTAIPTSVYESSDSTIYITDFLSGNIDIYVRKESYYVNLDLFLDRSYLNKFPSVVHRVTVEDNYSNPIIGLSSQNFSVYEDDYLIPKIDFYETKEMDEYRFVYLIDDSVEAKPYEDKISEEIINFTQALTNNDEAMLIYYNDDIKVASGFENRNLRIIQNATNFTFTGGVSGFSFAMHEAVRLSANSFKKTAIIIFSASQIDDVSFKDRPYSEIMFYAKNSGIPITVVYLGENKSNYFLDRISDYTQGNTIDAYESIQYASELDYLKTRDFGKYYIRYKTANVAAKKGEYRGTRLIVNYRDIYGEDETGYIIP